MIQILQDSNIELFFGIGITLEENLEAELVRPTGELPYFLFNPEKLHKPSLTGKGRWMLVQELKQWAIHEIAHLSYSDHNENFITVVHALDLNTWKNEAQYKKLAKIKKVGFLE